MLKCREVAEQASEYNEGALPWHRRLAFALHLLICGHCRRFVGQLRLTVAFLRLAPRSRLEREEAERISARVMRQSAAGTEE